MSDQDLRDRLAKLPHRALVAFAARCARRVRPLANVLPGAIQVAIDEAITDSETFAQEGTVTPAAADRATKAAAEANAVAAATRAAAVGPDVAANSAWTSLEDAIASAQAPFLIPEDVTMPDDLDETIGDEDPDEPDEDEVDESPGFVLVEAAARADVEQLLALGFGEPGTPGSPIDPSESGPLGPLWPAGAPDWYTTPPPPRLGEAVATAHAELDPVVASAQVVLTPPAAEMDPERLVLEAEVSEYADTEEVAEALARLGYALNQ